MLRVVRVLVVGVVALLVPGCLAGLCDNVPYDLMFLLDGSSSISKADFIRQLNFVYNMIAELDVSSDRVRVGLTEYSSRGSATTIIPLGQYSARDDLLEAVCQSGICDYCYRCGSDNYFRNFIVTIAGTLECCKDYSALGDACCCYEHGACPIFHLLGGTYPSYGFAAVATEFEQRGRNTTYQFVVMTTDGEFGEDTTAASDALKANGAIIVAVGVGQYNRTQLVNTATAENFVFDVTNFVDLGGFIDPIVRELCVLTSSTSSPSVTPSVTSTRTATPSVSQSRTPSVSQSATSSPSPTPTPSASPTPSPSASRTPTPTRSPTPTASPTSTTSVTPTPTPSQSPTPTRTGSPSPSPSGSPSATRTPTQTPSSSRTPSVTPTVTPSPVYSDNELTAVLIGAGSGLAAAVGAAGVAVFLVRKCMPKDEDDDKDGEQVEVNRGRLYWRRATNIVQNNLDIVVNPLYLQQQQTVQKRLADVEGQLALSDEPKGDGPKIEEVEEGGGGEGEGEGEGVGEEQPSPKSETPPTPRE